MFLYCILGIDRVRNVGHSKGVFSRVYKEGNVANIYLCIEVQNKFMGMIPGTS